MGENFADQFNFPHAVEQGSYKTFHGKQPSRRDIKYKFDTRLVSVAEIFCYSYICGRKICGRRFQQVYSCLLCTVQHSRKCDRAFADRNADVATRGTCVLWATHLVEEAERADRVLLLHQGSLLADGAPAEVAHTLGGTTLEEGFIRATAAPARSETTP